MNLSALEPDLLAAFVTVAERRSFTRAAAALHRTQSAVSMQVRRLEDRLGVALFRRTTAQVEMTPAGEDLLDYARRLLSLGEEALARVQQSKVEGRVRLGVMEDYGATLVPPLLARFARAFPRIQVEMEIGLTASMPDRLGSDFDLVVAMHPKGANGGKLLRYEQPIWAFGAGTTIPPEEPLALALAPSGCLFRSWAIEALDAAKRAWRIAFVSQSHAAVASVVGQGLAVTVVKAGICPPGLRQLTVREGWPALPLAEVRLHRAARLGPAAQHLGDHLADSLGTATALG